MQSSATEKRSGPPLRGDWPVGPGTTAASSSGIINTSDIIITGDINTTTSGISNISIDITVININTINIGINNNTMAINITTNNKNTTTWP